MLIKNNISAVGFCRKCCKEHFLYEGNAKNHCIDLIEKLEKYKRLDFEVSETEANPMFSTDYVFGKARGQMFGVLECKNPQNEILILKSFSGQYNGKWEIKGWVPPLLNPEKFDKTVYEEDKKIKELGREINVLPDSSVVKKKLIKKRKKLSQTLLKEIYSLYKVNTFSGDQKSLFDVFPNKGIPTGTGDCCAPKLLNYAALNKLTPISLAEFYFGKENLSHTKKHKTFYSSCRDKCYPILGEILCGLKSDE